MSVAVSSSKELSKQPHLEAFKKLWRTDFSCFTCKNEEKITKEGDDVLIRLPEIMIPACMCILKYSLNAQSKKKKKTNSQEVHAFLRAGLLGRAAGESLCGLQAGAVRGEVGRT